MQPLIDLSRGKTKKIATIFEVTDFIGDGHFAQVYKAYNLMTKTDLAIKIYHGYDEHTSEIAKNEIGLLQELEDLNTDYFPVPKGGLRKQKIENRNHPLIAMELCEYRSEDDEAAGHIIALNDLLILGGNQITQTGKVNNIWDRDVLFSFMNYLCDAVNTLHKKEIIHRDIKPSNILIKKPVGENTIKPFFIDFNTSKSFGSEESTGGTDSYLPPEVRSRNRTHPDKADDLWALAKIIGELVYGKNVEIIDTAKPHQLIEYKLPSKLVEVIQVGLETNPEKRYSDAASFMAAINEATSGERIEIEDDEEDFHVEGDELVWIRENKNNILRDLINIFCGDNQLPVLKETQDKVSSIYSSLYQDSTKSFELKEEVIRLGVSAVPALIEKSYKLIPNTFEFDVILEALTILANSDEKLTKKAIDLYCVSSDYSVRKICLSLSDNLQYFPTNLIDSIVDNDSLYLPDERVNIADICIKWSTDKNAMMPLNMYMCKLCAQ
jgi:serine/threonine protein kinase